MAAAATSRRTRVHVTDFELGVGGQSVNRGYEELESAARMCVKETHGDRRARLDTYNYEGYVWWGMGEIILEET